MIGNSAKTISIITKRTAELYRNI